MEVVSFRRDVHGFRAFLPGSASVSCSLAPSLPASSLPLPPPPFALPHLIPTPRLTLLSLQFLSSSPVINSASTRAISPLPSPRLPRSSSSSPNPLLSSHSLALSFFDSPFMGSDALAVAFFLPSSYLPDRCRGGSWSLPTLTGLVP